MSPPAPLRGVREDNPRATRPKLSCAHHELTPRYRLILPLDTHPLVKHAEGRTPSIPEIDFILAGPGGRYPTDADEDAPADDAARQHSAPAPRPEYIM